MSRKLLAFLLSELNTVRIVCKGCQAITEMTTEKASGKFQQPRCPVCSEFFIRPNPGREQPYNPLFDLLVAIEQMKQLPAVDVEFVLPDNDEQKPELTNPKK